MTDQLSALEPEVQQLRSESMALRELLTECQNKDQELQSLKGNAIG